MRLDGRRESSNVDDRRGSGGFRLGGKGGLGIGAAIVIGLIVYCTTGDLNQAFQVASTTGDMTSVVTGQNGSNEEYQPTAEEQELASFAKKVLASTEDVWTAEFQKMGKTYEPPTLVLFSGSVQSGCGGANASTGPFYCSADQCVYIDLSFFTSMKSQLGSDGDFAYAYVIAHEVGHHVENLLGTLNEAHQKMARLNSKEANKISVRLELLADFYAGVWAYHDNKMFGSIEDGDLEEAINCAEVIGDNYLQEKANGRSVPETFTHGTSAQRMRWLKLGLETGDIRKGTTFQKSDAEL